MPLLVTFWRSFKFLESSRCISTPYVYLNRVCFSSPSSGVGSRGLTSSMSRYHKPLGYRAAHTSMRIGGRENCCRHEKPRSWRCWAWLSWLVKDWPRYFGNIRIQSSSLCGRRLKVLIMRLAHCFSRIRQLTCLLHRRVLLHLLLRLCLFWRNRNAAMMAPTKTERSEMSTNAASQKAHQLIPFGGGQPQTFAFLVEKMARSSNFIISLY